MLRLNQTRRERKSADSWASPVPAPILKNIYIFKYTYFVPKLQKGVNKEKESKDGQITCDCC